MPGLVPGIHVLRPQRDCGAAPYEDVLKISCAAAKAPLKFNYLHGAELSGDISGGE
jgi:hypothetical protein